MEDSVPRGSSDPGSRTRAEQVFGEWLARRDAHEQAEFERFCSEHPEQAAFLRTLHEGQRQFGRASGPRSTAASESLAERLRASFGSGIDPQVSLGKPEETASTTASSSSTGLVRRLREHLAERSRYRMAGEIARGGMGAILEVWDEDLRRKLAMKVHLARVEAAEGGSRSSLDKKHLARFLEEAQITGQLDHPGIVPVHELGLDSEGRVYFTMKLVKGRNLKEIIELVHAGQEGWNMTRALGVLLKVCEATAYAHAKGVIHRDLKPSNVMVGHFGEVYVMDWGLARVLERRDAHDVRPDLGDAPSISVHTERRSEREEDPDSPLLTMGGDVVGTPAYMSPEQARGEVERVGMHSDVYALGALLYHLLTGQVPYVPPRAKVSARSVLLRVIEGPPKPIHELRDDVPAELEAICEKAMAREPAARYPDTLALAEDLRAFLEHRVVRAYETGAVAELRKWIARNRALAGASAAAILALVAGLAVSSVLYVRAEDNAEQATDNARTARANELRALAGEELAKKKADEVLRLSALQDMNELVARAERLWPSHPENVERFREWLADAGALVAELPRHEATLAEIRARGRPAAAGETHDGQPEGAWIFDSSEDRWWHAQLDRLVQRLTALIDAEHGLASAGITRDRGWGVRRRLEWAETVAERSRDGEQARASWTAAIASIANPRECPPYRGLALEPQLGLLPIGRDPDSGLWEFAHLQTGSPARRGADGRLLLEDGTGLVFVLLPGGTFRMGAQRERADQPNHDPSAEPEEAPVHEVRVQPFFLSKYEMTQGQWLRIAGRNPSLVAPAGAGRKAEAGLLNPVEQVNWFECEELMRWLGLALPSEEEWEYAARAESSSPWWTGAEPESLDGAANLADSTYGKHSDEPFEPWLTDGHLKHAPAGSFAPSPFGLHDVHGNVFEWCSNAFGAYGRSPAAPREPEAVRRVLRGGSFTRTAIWARSSFRLHTPPEQVAYNIGLRPARAISRP